MERGPSLLATAVFHAAGGDLEGIAVYRSDEDSEIAKERGSLFPFLVLGLAEPTTLSIGIV